MDWRIARRFKIRLKSHAGEGLASEAEACLVDRKVSLNRQLLDLAWPSLVENLLQTMLGVVDLMMVGRLGPDAIAGVGLATQVMNVLLVTFMGLSVGNTALVARFVGAQRKDQAQWVAKQSLVLGGAVSIVVAAFGFLFSKEVISLMGGSPQVSEQGGSFLRIISTFSLVMALGLIASGTLRGSGDTRTPMLVTGFINFVNIGLDYVLIFGKFGFPALGVKGSAIATTSARAIGAAMLLYVLFKRGSVLKLSWFGSWRPQRDMLGRLLKIGGPAALEQLTFSLGMTAFSIMVVSLGTAELAAQQIAFNAASISIMPAFAFGVAATTLVGQNLGARSPRRAEESALQALRSGLVWMSTMGLLIILFRRQLVGLYSQDPDVLRLGAMCLTFIGLAQPLQAMAIILGSALRGAGDTRGAMMVTVAGVWGLRLPVGWLLGLGLGLGLFGVWLGWAADFICRATFMTLRYRSGKWKEIKV